MGNKETIHTYFKLFDSIDKQPDSLEQIVSLFSRNGVIIAADGNVFRGENAIEAFFTDFFTENTKVEHEWTLNENLELSADWSAIVTRSDQSTFTLEGTDYYEFDIDGKIKELKMVVL